VKNDLAVPWHQLLPHQYAEWLSHEDAPALPEAAAPHLPIDSTLHLIGERGTRVLSDDALTIFSGRAAGGFAELVAKWCREGNVSELSRVLPRVPGGVSATYCQALPSADVLLHGQAVVLHEVRTFLIRAVRKRHPGFEQAFDLLRAIERGVGPLRQLP
jgi:hypothetical protein